MKKAPIKFILATVISAGMILSLNACTAAGASGAVSFTDLNKSTQVAPTVSLPTETFTPTELPISTPAPALTPTQTEIEVQAGETVTVPILLYHHISNNNPGNRYYISPQTFNQQMTWLADHQYQTITISQLANVITHGGKIPQRAVVITFDDGNADVVANAFPIMQKFGFVGTAYIIANWVGAPGYDTGDQLKQLQKAGWEIGSHTSSHVDLTKHEDNLQYEIRESLVKLQTKYGMEVKSLAYPFGMIDPKVVAYTAHAGYTSAVGLGTLVKQGLGNLYYLSRMEIRQDYSMDQFIALLPWE